MLFSYFLGLYKSFNFAVCMKQWISDILDYYLDKVQNTPFRNCMDIDLIFPFVLLFPHKCRRVICFFEIHVYVDFVTRIAFYGNMIIIF